ncbi:MAG: PEP-CTERM sorting domain-containing protein [Planctomycetaceae bacterium]
MAPLSRLALAAFVAFPALTARVAAGALVQSFQSSGNLGLEVVAVDANPILGTASSLTGTFSLTQVLPGATIVKAFVYSHDWGSGGGATLSSFGLPPPAGSPPLAAIAFQSDTSVFPLLFAYQWDVTSFMGPVVPPTSYSFTINSANAFGQLAGAALVVVWQAPQTPFSTVTIVDGARQVGETVFLTPPSPDTEAASFSGLPAGPTNLYLFTVSDDSNGSNEVVRYNGTTVGGPLDSNLGFSASLLQLNVTSVAGSNSVSITSPGDHFGWILAASIVPGSPVPEPGTLAVFGAGLAGVLGYAFRRSIAGAAFRLR